MIKVIKEGFESEDYIYEIKSGEFWNTRTTPDCSLPRLGDIFLKIYDFMKHNNEEDEFLHEMLPEMISSGIEFGIKKQYFDIVENFIWCIFNKDAKGQEKYSAIIWDKVSRKKALEMIRVIKESSTTWRDMLWDGETGEVEANGKIKFHGHYYSKDSLDANFPENGDEPYEGPSIQSEDPDWVISTDHATGIKIFNAIKRVLKGNNIPIAESKYDKYIPDDEFEYNGFIYLDDTYESGIFVGSYVCDDFGYNVSIENSSGGIDPVITPKVISSIKSIVSKYPGWDFQVD